MNFFDIFKKKEEKSITSQDLLSLIAGGYGSKSGVDVNLNTALQVSTVLACATVVAEGIADLPLNLFKEDEKGNKSKIIKHDIKHLLTKKPNSWQTPFEFFEALTLHAFLTGNGFAYKNIVNGRVRELIPLMPSQVTVEQSKNYELTYLIRDGNNVVGRFTADKIFHLRGRSWNAYLGMDIVKKAREAIGLSIAAESSQANLHAKGSRPSGMLSTDENLSAEMLTKISEQWKASYSGSDNAGKTPVLDNGMKFVAMAMTGVDAQHLETRRFQVEEICRTLKVFPQMVMQTDKASTYASAAAFFAAHTRHTLSPWMKRWGQKIETDLIKDESVTVDFDTNELNRAPLKDRGEYYRTVAEMGIVTRNELRVMEGLPPLSGLDDPLTPMNMNQGQPNEEE